MAYAEFEATLKKYVSDGKKVITLEVEGSALSGKMEALEAMMKQKVRISLESEVVHYNIQINARTEMPIRTYLADESGVKEIKPEGEQVEMDLGVPQRADPIKDVPEEISRKVVDEFILSGLAPQPGNNHPIAEWIGRLIGGESYLRLASETGISSGKIVDLIDEYRQMVAPSAAAWDEWRKAKAGAGTEIDPDEDDEDEQEDAGVAEQDPEPDADYEDYGQSSDDSEIEMEDGGEPVQAGQVDSEEAPATADDLDAYILTARPLFDEIPYDFPELLARRKSGETWMKIANSMGLTSGQLSTAWSEYKKLAKKHRGSSNGAA